MHGVAKRRQVRRMRARAAAYVERAARRGDYAFEDFPGAKANQITDARTPQPGIFVRDLVPPANRIIRFHINVQSAFGGL
jgi:hypothetical protein